MVVVMSLKSAVMWGNTKTKMYMNGTVRSWIHYIKLRTDPSTQKEHRDIANSVKKIFFENLPVIYSAMDW